MAAPRAGDPHRGAEAFRQCAACHAVEPGQHLTGPSLARIWGRKLGTVEGFARYSDALRKTDLVWTAETLDRWLEDPGALVPGNTMTFPGVKDAQQRADLLAYLQAVSEGHAPGPPGRGMMAAGPRMKLKELGREYRVRAIRYCGDAYHVTTEAGDTLPIWEFNLRVKTDSSADGPTKGHPVLIRAGMMGDRAFLVFAAPEEISAAIQRKC
ncbi:MAG: c-type cytochrome [Candidatus Rokubacteria bacterium]|nr:c-type cytochrome [Candidatus Rokubacteria bacterium]